MSAILLGNPVSIRGDCAQSLCGFSIFFQSVRWIRWLNRNAKYSGGGGGMSGLTAAFEVKKAGTRFISWRKNSYLGGEVAQLLQYFPMLCLP